MLIQNQSLLYAVGVNIQFSYAIKGWIYLVYIVRNSFTRYPVCGILLPGKCD